MSDDDLAIQIAEIKTSLKYIKEGGDRRDAALLTIEERLRRQEKSTAVLSALAGGLAGVASATVAGVMRNLNS